MTDFTPGPWFSGDKHTSSSIHNGKGRSICSTGGYADNSIDPDVMHRENVANANLVAAAPELLAALTKLSSVLPMSAVNSIPMNVLQKVESAIAKAEGRA